MMRRLLPLVLGLAVVGRFRIDLVPQRAEDVRPPRIALLESDEDFVVHFRDEMKAAALSRHG